MTKPAEPSIELDAIPPHVLHRIAEEMTKRFGFDVNDHRVETVLLATEVPAHHVRPTLHVAIIDEARSYGIKVPA